MSNLSDFRWGLTSGLIAFPLGLALGGLAAKTPWLVQFMGTEWFVFKACVSTCVMSGFAIGHALHKNSRRKHEPVKATMESDF